MRRGRIRGMRRRGNKVPLFLLPLALVMVFLLVEASVRPALAAFAEAQARWRVTEAIQQAVLERVASGVSYRELVYVEKDSQERVVFMQPDTMRINRLAAQTALAVQAALEELQAQTIGIPLGMVLGSQLLANLGPRLRLEIVPLGTVESKVEDSFEAAGINQTRHRIFMQVRVPVRVVIPLLNDQLLVETRVPIADAVIVGPVPNTYLLVEGQGRWDRKGLSP